VKILTTHVGSLPGPPGFDPVSPDDAALRAAVEWVVAEQRAAGLDIINEGELTKQGDWLAFMDHRLGGFEDRPAPQGGSVVAGVAGRRPAPATALTGPASYGSTPAGR